MKYAPLISALLFVILFITCAPEKAAYDKELGPNDGGLVYLTQATQSAGLLNLSIVLPAESAAKTISACFGGLGVPKDNITVEFEVDQKAIDSMNNLRVKQELPPYSPYPSESFSLDQTSVTIPAGKECSSSVKFVYKPRLFSTSEEYLTAYRISKVSGGYKINKPISSILLVVVKPSLQPIDPMNLSATADSEEPSESRDGGLTDLNGYAAAATDGKWSTYWHSVRTPQTTPFPHWLLVDLGAVRYIGKIGLVRRTGGKSNVFKTFDVEASLDGAAWVNLLKRAEMSNVFTVEQTYLTATTRCQFLKLTMTSAYANADHTMLAEFIPYELK